MKFVLLLSLCIWAASIGLLAGKHDSHESHEEKDGPGGPDKHDKNNKNEKQDKQNAAEAFGWNWGGGNKQPSEPPLPLHMACRMGNNFSLENFFHSMYKNQFCNFTFRRLRCSRKFN